MIIFSYKEKIIIHVEEGEMIEVKVTLDSSVSRFKRHIPLRAHLDSASVQNSRV